MPPRTPDTAYRDTEEGRALLQLRLARYGRVAFIMCVAFYPIGLFTRAQRASAWYREKGSALRSLRPSVPVSTGTSRTLRVTRELRV